MGAILVYDVTRPDTFSNCALWLQELWQYSGRGIVPVVLLGNKNDLRDELPTHITREQGREYASNITDHTKDCGFCVNYLDTSAKTGLNVDIAFETLAKNVFSWVDHLKAK